MLIVPSTIAAPAAITLVFEAPVFAGDLTQVSAVNANLQRQNGTTINLGFTIISATPNELVAQYVFVGGEIQGTGAYALAPVLTVPGGTLPTTSVAMFVASPWSNALQKLQDVSWVAVTAAIPPSTLTGAFTQTTAPFTQPAANANVTVAVKSSIWMAVGQPIFMQSGGAYKVISLPTTTSVVLQNVGGTGNASPNTVIASPSQVTAGGVSASGGTSAIASYPQASSYAVLSTDAVIVIDSSGWTNQPALSTTLPATPSVGERHLFNEDGWISGRPPPLVNANGLPIQPYSQTSQVSKPRAAGNIAAITDLGGMAAWVWTGSLWALD